MLKISRFIGKCLFFIIFSSSAALSSNISVDHMPREFRGEFLWRKQNEIPYAVTLKIAEIEEANDGNLIFKGVHVYQPGHLMKVKGTIDPKTGHISIFEMDPSGEDREDWITDGSFEGKISKDMSFITAVWTTKTTGEKGDIALKAVRWEYATTEEIKETDPVALNKQGVAFNEKGQYDQAIAYFNKAIEINPKFAWAYNNRGNAYRGKGQYDKAFSDYNKAIEISPRIAMPYTARGSAFADIGEYDKAISDHTKALEIYPRFARAYNSRALAYQKKGQYDKAISDLTKAIEINPRFARAYNNRGFVYQKKGQYDKAISDFTKTIEIKPKDTKVTFFAFISRALNFAFKGENDEAISDYTKAIKIKPRNAGAYYGRGVVYFYKRDYEKAWDDVNRAESLGFDVVNINPEFIKDLRQASGRQK